MALGPSGSITVNADASVTKSGMRGRMYDALGVIWDVAEAGFQTSFQGGTLTKVLKQVRQTRANFAYAFADWLLDELTNYAEVTTTIATSDSGLQRTPNPNNADTNTQGPSATKTLGGSIS